MIVIDASAVVDAITQGPRAETLRRHLGASGRLVAPDLLFVEIRRRCGDWSGPTS